MRFRTFRCWSPAARVLSAGTWCAGLLDAGASVRVLDNFSHGSEENLRGAEAAEVMRGDIRNPDDCTKAVQGRQFVFHLAALGSVPRSVEQPLLYNEVNIGGTLNVFEAARQAKVRRVVYSASSSAYGDTPVLPKIETMTPSPKSPYAVTKLVGEYYCRVYAEVYGLSTMCLRYFNVFGPRQNPKSQYAAVIPAFITALLNGESPRIYGDGEQTRDFCFVANVVKANMLSAVSSAALRGKSIASFPPRRWRQHGDNDGPDGDPAHLRRRRRHRLRHRQHGEGQLRCRGRYRRACPRSTIRP